VLLSGANGFIAAWVDRSLLEKGFFVRGTVRSEAKSTPLRKEFASYGDKFEVVVVPDIAKDGAFDELIKDVDAIEHTASPVHFNAVEPDGESLFSRTFPSAYGHLQNSGTLGILESVRPPLGLVGQIRVYLTFSPSLKRDHVDPEPKLFSELDWNEQSPTRKEVEKMGREAPPMTKYRASKTLAEKGWSNWQ
ncbi:NAD(P)-binding protein, partial [Mycena amicta]